MVRYTSEEEAKKQQQHLLRPVLFRRLKHYSLRFCVPYFTQWGHSLVVLGSDPALGSWSPGQALAMVPHHHGQELLWSADLSVPSDFQGNYSYCVVDENRRIVRRESGAPRSLLLSEDLPDGAFVDIHDLWQDASSPESFLSRSAFQGVIFQREAAADEEGQLLQKGNVLSINFIGNSQDSVLVQFRIICPRVQSGQSVFLTGSVAALGRFSFEEALRLSTVQGCCWQGECLIKRSEFPLRYPINRNFTFFFLT